MKLEVLLSVMNLDKHNLDKMNITSSCTVINQCGKEGFEKYKNFKIYSYDEIGLSTSRNRGLENVKEDIILISDDDLVYDNDFEKNIIDEFKNNKDADMIFFNVHSPYRKKRVIKKRKRLHIYNSLHFASCNIAFRRKSIGNIRFDPDFGPNSKFGNGSDTIFIVKVLRNKLKIYSSPVYIGTVYHEKSTWFKGYNEKYFFNKGAIFTYVSIKLRHILMLQYLIRHREVLTDLKFKDAYKAMKNGSNAYINYLNNKQGT